MTWLLPLIVSYAGWMARKDIQNVWVMASMLFLGWRGHIRYPTSQKSALTIRLKHISRCDEREITVPSCFILFHCIEKDSRCLVSGSRRKKMKVNLSVCKALLCRTILICSDKCMYLTSSALTKAPSVMIACLRLCVEAYELCRFLSV